MIIEGTLEGIEVDGYERILSVRMVKRTIWCSFVQSNEYLEPRQNSAVLTVGDRVQFSVALRFITKYELLEPSVKKGLFQKIEKSPSSFAIGCVIKRVDVHLYLISIGDGVMLDVDFETNVDLGIGAQIRVEGELVAEKFSRS